MADDTITAEGYPTCGCCGGKNPYKPVKRTYKNYCPHCKKTGTLDAGTLGNSIKGVKDGEITCSQAKGGCDADYCVFCFHKDTNLFVYNKTLDIYETKTIQNIVNSEYTYTIKSYNKNNDTIEWKEISEKFHNPPKELYKYQFTNGESITCTKDHQFYTKNYNLIHIDTAYNNKIELQTSENKTVNVISKTYINTEDTYNIQVKDNHNYFIHTILVKNCGGDKWGRRNGVLQCEKWKLTPADESTDDEDDTGEGDSESTYDDMIKDLLKPLDGEVEYKIRGNKVYINKIPSPEDSTELWVREGVNITGEGVTIQDYNPDTPNFFLINWGEEFENQFVIKIPALIERFGVKFKEVNAVRKVLKWVLEAQSSESEDEDTELTTEETETEDTTTN